MKKSAVHPGDVKTEVRHHKPKHLAEKLERFVGMGMGAVAAVLLVGLLFAFMQTGNGTPPWMQ